MSDMNQPRPGFSPSNYQMPPQSHLGAGQFPPNSRYGNMGTPNRPGQANMPNAGFGHPVSLSIKMFWKYVNLLSVAQPL